MKYVSQFAVRFKHDFKDFLKSFMDDKKSTTCTITIGGFYMNKYGMHFSILGIDYTLEQDIDEIVCRRMVGDAAELMVRHTISAANCPYDNLTYETIKGGNKALNEDYVETIILYK